MTKPGTANINCLNVFTFYIIFRNSKWCLTGVTANLSCCINSTTDQTSITKFCIWRKYLCLIDCDDGNTVLYTPELRSREGVYWVRYCPKPQSHLLHVTARLARTCTVECHLSGRHWSGHVEYPTVGSIRVHSICTVSTQYPDMLRILGTKF